MLNLAILILSPFVLLGSALLLMLSKTLKLIPSGMSFPLAYAIIVALLMGGILSASMAEALFIKPARLQRHYLGNLYGSPLSLRHYFQGGFQDPWQEWSYDLTTNQAAQLKKECSADYIRQSLTACTLYSEMDDRWFVEFSLDGRQLSIKEGLH